MPPTYVISPLPHDDFQALSMGGTEQGTGQGTLLLAVSPTVFYYVTSAQIDVAPTFNVFISKSIDAGVTWANVFNSPIASIPTGALVVCPSLALDGTTIRIIIREQTVVQTPLHVFNFDTITDTFLADGADGPTMDADESAGPIASIRWSDGTILVMYGKAAVDPTYFLVTYDPVADSWSAPTQFATLSGDAMTEICGLTLWSSGDFAVAFLALNDIDGIHLDVALMGISKPQTAGTITTIITGVQSNGFTVACIFPGWPLVNIVDQYSFLFLNPALDFTPDINVLTFGSLQLPNTTPAITSFSTVAGPGTPLNAIQGYASATGGPISCQFYSGGVWYVYYLQDNNQGIFGNVDSVTQLMVSTSNNGVSWSTPVEVFNSTAFGPFEPYLLYPVQIDATTSGLMFALINPVMWTVFPNPDLYGALSAFYVSITFPATPATPVIIRFIDPKGLPVVPLPKPKKC